MSKRKREYRSLSANECGAGIYAEPVPVRPPEIKNHRKVVFLFPACCIIAHVIYRIVEFQF